MYIQDKIINTIPIFEVSETLKDVIKFFEETTYSHVGVTENGLYLGLLSENDLACFEPEKKVDDFRFEMEDFFVERKRLGWMFWKCSPETRPMCFRCWTKTV